MVLWLGTVMGLGTIMALIFPLTHHLINSGSAGHVQYSPEHLRFNITALVLTLIWGVAWAYTRKDKQ